MSQFDWEEFYKSFKVKKPSAFAKFARPYFKKGSLIYDLGCGNGRDTYYLSKKCFVVGYDKNVKPQNKKKAVFRQISFEELIRRRVKSPDGIYLRFVLHAIPTGLRWFLLDWAVKILNPDGILAIEARSDKDKPPKGHKRWLLNFDELLRWCKRKKLTILYQAEQTGFAQFGDEDPVIIRLICKKP